MMIHHQLLPLNQLQMPQLLPQLLPHIRIPPKKYLSFTAHSMVFRRAKNVQPRKLPFL